MKQNNEQQLSKVRHKKGFNKEPLKDEIFIGTVQHFLNFKDPA